MPTEKLKKMYFIHENTIPIKIDGFYVSVATNYVVTMGYYCYDDNEIYNDLNKTIILENYIPNLFWDTYEQGERQLAKLLRHIVYNFSDKIKENFDTLLKNYPEEMI